MSKIKVLFVAVFVILFTNSVYANSENAGYEEAKIIADSKMAEVSDGEEECRNEIELLNLKDEVVGYYFQYENVYVIVGTNKNNVPIIEYGEDGCFLSEAAKTINKDIDEIKVLYLGGISYAFVVDGDECYYIGTEGIEKCSITDLQEESISNIENVEEQWEMAENLATQGSTYKGGEIVNPANYEKYYYSSTRKTVQNYSFSYELMSNFSGYSDHCAPTAAVNLMKYWYLRDNTKYNSVLKTSWANSFSILHNYMGTTVGIGTYTSNLVNAYKNYLNSCSGLSGATVKLISNCTISNVITEINAGYPVHLCVYDNNYYSNHSLLGLGYVSYTYYENSVYTSVNYIMVADGWKSSARYVNCSIGTGKMDIVTVRMP